MEDTTIAFENDGFEILIEVKNPQLKGEHITHMTYMLVGQDKLGPIKVQRRYSDFTKTRGALLVRWPGCYVPPVPSKKIVGNYDPEFVQQRMRGFRFFLDSLKKIHYLWYSEEAQILLKQTIIQDIEKPLSILCNVSSEQMIQRYNKSFAEIQQRATSPDDINKISLFTIFLKKALETVRNLMDVHQYNMDITKQYRQQATNMLTYFLPEYQKNCIKQYVPNINNEPNEESFIFYLNKDEVLHEQIAKFKQANEKTDVTLIYQSLRLEKREIKAFLQTIEILDNYKNQYTKAVQKLKDLEADKLKLYSGKQTVAKLIKAKSKQEAIKEVQYAIALGEKEKNNWNEIVQIATGLLSFVEIDKFKKRKQEFYYQTVKTSCELQLNIAKRENELWRSVLKSQALSATDPF